jgi:ABC-type Fe3+ transport system permease subunit
VYQVTALRIILMVLMAVLLYRTLLFLTDRMHGIKLRKRKKYVRENKNRYRDSNIVACICLVLIFILLIFVIVKISIRGV